MDEVCRSSSLVLYFQERRDPDNPAKSNRIKRCAFLSILGAVWRFGIVTFPGPNKKYCETSVKIPQSTPFPALKQLLAAITPRFLLEMKALCTLLALVSATSFLQSATLPESARIDAILAKEWQKNKLQPNAPATDDVFLRRIYVDIAGRIPTSDEAREFIASTDKDKRAQLIDKLLSSDGYTANFFNYFADILRLQTDTKGQLTGYAYADWLKQALAKNQPWDSMVRELITADGSSWNNGAVGFYMRDQGMPLDHMAAYVQVFLGTQMVCAQCHDHPFDKWSQLDYYHMAAYTYGTDSKKGYGIDLGKSMTMDRKQRKSPEAAQLRKDMKEVAESIKDVTKTLRYTTIDQTDRLPKLPADYKYANGKPGDAIAPMTVFGAAAPVADGVSRPEALAEWMTSPTNPRFSLVIANRLWKRAMGMGIIEPVDELTDSSTPSNAELMAYLEQLMKDKKFDLKAYLRVIYNSDVYQRMPSQKDVELGAVYHFTGPLMRRMSSEQVWDSVVTLVKGNKDADAAAINLAAESKLDALGKLHDTLSNTNPKELVQRIKANGGGSDNPETEAKIKELTAKAAEARRAGKKEEAQALSRQVNSLRNKSQSDAFVAVLGKEGAEEFKSEYRGGNMKSKPGKENMARVSLSREEMAKIRAEAGGDRKKAKALMEVASQRGRLGASVVASATRAADMPSPAPRGHMLRTFGQSDRETIENASRESTVPQALTLLNGPVADALLNPSSNFAKEIAAQPSADARMDAIYLGLLSRFPTADEKKILSSVVADRGELAQSDVVHALLNAGEFLFIR